MFLARCQKSLGELEFERLFGKLKNRLAQDSLYSGDGKLKHYHLRYAFIIQKWVPDTETVIIPGKISIIPLQFPPSG
ncbi:hypothetical protein E2C01_024600 [Portunus trituberculatus]|uniref:Uncharacterized protein n=1 Tax=Portunus trituberculatus TaxID=210409 RepID=A0A5B7EF85_PORTR|nr:hypothetical protein [Portunus trituberculatus]